MDGVTWQIFLEDLEEVYGSMLSGRRPDLATTTPFTIWSQKQNAHATSPQMEDEFSFWSKETLQELWPQAWLGF